MEQASARALTPITHSTAIRTCLIRRPGPSRAQAEKQALLLELQTSTRGTLVARTTVLVNREMLPNFLKLERLCLLNSGECGSRSSCLGIRRVAKKRPAKRRKRADGLSCRLLDCRLVVEMRACFQAAIEANFRLNDVQGDEQASKLVGNVMHSIGRRISPIKARPALMQLLTMLSTRR